MKKVIGTLIATFIHFIPFAQDLSYDKNVLKEVKSPYTIKDYFLLFPISELPAIGEDDSYLLTTTYRKKIIDLYQQAEKNYQNAKATVAVSR